MPQWVPSRCGTSGNEAADKLAKQGAVEDQEDNTVSFHEMETLIMCNRTPKADRRLPFAKATKRAGDHLSSAKRLQRTEPAHAQETPTSTNIPALLWRNGVVSRTHPAGLLQPSAAEEGGPLLGQRPHYCRPNCKGPKVICRGQQGHRRYCLPVY